MLEIVICDDNTPFLTNTSKILEHIIKIHSLNARIVCKANSLYELENFLKHNTANVFFMDIDFKTRETGLNHAIKIRESNHNAYIIFISAHLEFVFQAFKAKPFNFIPKPVTKEILEECLLDIYNDHIKTFDNTISKFIEIKTGTTLYKLKTSDIIFIEKAYFRTIIHAKNCSVQCYETLEAIMNKLSDDNFIRCHKSFICNKTYITEIRFKTREILLENGFVCYIGKKYLKELMN